MNDLEYLRQMRSLNRPVAPPRDLWAGIEARLDGPAAVTPVRHRRGHAWAMAAAIAGVAVLSGGIGLRLAPGGSDAVAEAPAHWKPTDPRLTGAAVELDAARLELTQAMQDSPQSPALQRLLQKTERQRDRLRSFDKQAG
ncbi:hypothetical protein KPL74_13090 [Bacillus sp. NP157]|nr:hypothetical protein KPL74_13090 [Bacillus sp. NP157]